MLDFLNTVPRFIEMPSNSIQSLDDCVFISILPLGNGVQISNHLGETLTLPDGVVYTLPLNSGGKYSAITITTNASSTAKITYSK